MKDFNNTWIESLVIHSIGNITNKELCIFSNKQTLINKELNDILSFFFTQPFKNESDSYNFFHDTELSLNEIFVYSTNIFNQSNSFINESIKIGKHLYNNSDHPKIKKGEFYVALLKDCVINGLPTDAIGLFKTENKDTFLRVNQNESGFEIGTEKGININKLDKGCLIFNIEKENGYVVSVVDNTNKGVEAKYWLEDFLNVKPRNDGFTKTQNTLSLYKSFITKKLPNEFEINKAEQAALLNKSLIFFKENTEISLSDFAKEVIEQPELIESFNQYKNQYEKEHEIEIGDSFRVSESAVKKQARKFRSVIKLDKNFHIYVHGDEHLIEQGEDKDGWKYYKIYYKEES